MMYKKKMGMRKETFEHICNYLNTLEIDLEKGLILNRKVNYLTFGYYKVGLAGKKVYLHQILATARWGEKCVGMTVNHINECKTDNSWNNLELLSHEDNVRMKTRSSGSCIDKLPIEAIHLDTDKIHLFVSVREAGRCLGLHSQSISKVLNGKRRRVGRYTFKKVN